MDMNALMRSEKLGIAEIGIGGRGACLDYMFFGRMRQIGVHLRPRASSQCVGMQTPRLR